MDNYTDTLIIGASFYGMALAKTLGNNALLIERGYRIGEEFSSTLRVSEFSGTVKTELGKRFLDGMKEHKLINENNNIYNTPSAYLLAEITEGARAYFVTEILGINKTREGYRVELFNQEGRREIYANRIIDTVTISESEEKRLNVIVRSREAEGVKYDPYINSYIFPFNAKPGEKLIDTRKRLYDYLLQNPSLGAVYIADCYDCDIEEPIIKKDENYYIIPSLGYKNPVSAVDAGGGGLLI